MLSNLATLKLFVAQKRVEDMMKFLSRVEFPHLSTLIIELDAGSKTRSSVEIFTSPRIPLPTVTHFEISAPYIDEFWVYTHAHLHHLIRQLSGVVDLKIGPTLRLQSLITDADTDVLPNLRTFSCHKSNSDRIPDWMYTRNGVGVEIKYTQY